jgi:uncharacterized protein (DUF1330 family)
MPAYIIVNIDVHDPEGYEEYKILAAPTLALYQGKYIVRGGANGVLEGTLEPKRIVLLEFPDMQHASDWWASPEYAPAKAIRQRTATTDMIFVEGI